MWTREELKANARENLKAYYWLAFVVTFLVGCLKGGGGEVQIRTEDITLEMIIAFATTILIIAVISFLLVTFITNILTVGMKRFFICARLGDASISHLFDGFRGGNYLKIVVTMFVMDIKIFLWSLLFIIPGIIKSYEYLMVPYILAEDSSISGAEAFRRSKIMMEGEKWNTFVLAWSFIGWYLLGLLACCIGMLFVVPYEEATMAELYDRLRQKVQPYEPVDQSYAGF